MRQDILLLAVIVMWIAVIVGTYQRLFEMPKWFSYPPASFELIRKQSKKSRLFWIPLSILFLSSICIALILNWQYRETRVHIVGSIICFGLTGALSGLYFVKEIISFTKIPENATLTSELIKRVKFWRRWTTIRDVLQFFAAVFVTIAYNHRGNL